MQAKVEFKGCLTTADDEGMQSGGPLTIAPVKRGRHAPVLPMVVLVVVLTALVSWGCDASVGSSRVFPEEVADSARAWEYQLWSDPSLTVCRVVIPKIDVDVAVVEGTDLADLARGPGHWPETPLPGQNGRVVISGHRSTYGGPFLRLGELQAGDLIQMVLPYGVAEYEVTGTEIVGPDEIQKVAQRGREELSLATCHPPGSDRFRLLVHAKAATFTQSP